MERVIDLDEAATVIADRRPAWRAAGLACAPPTWRDEMSPWPYRLETNRSEVSDPDSLGLRLHGPNETVLLVVLFRGGWADVDYIAGLDDAGQLPASSVTSTGAFGALLDTSVTRVFGVHPRLTRTHRLRRPHSP